MATPQLHFTSRRSPVLCTHGVVATSQPLASEAGLRILKAGGNAADAAVAAVAALNLTEACMCGLGGDAFCLYYDAATKSVRGLNGSGRAPQALTPERARAVAGYGANRLPAESVHCVTVPGAAHCWADCVSRFGRLPLADVLAPAIALAEEGVPIHAVAAQLWSDNAHQLLDRWGGLEGNPGAASLLVDGRPPRHGEVLRNPELAATLRTLASNGAEGFYKGAIAEAIVQCVRAKGGVMSLEDLAAHKTERVEPLSTTFRPRPVSFSKLHSDGVWVHCPFPHRWKDGPRAAPERVGPRGPDGAHDARPAAAVERATEGRPVPGGSAPHGLREGPCRHRRRRAGER